MNTVEPTSSPESKIQTRETAPVDFACTRAIPTPIYAERLYIAFNDFL